jgi:hypothetical protein
MEVEGSGAIRSGVPGNVGAANEHGYAPQQAREEFTRDEYRQY